MKICEHCGKEMPDDQVITTSDGHDYCGDCGTLLPSLGYAHCDGCGKWFPEDETHVTVDDDVYCDNCISNMGYAQCENCGDWVSRDDIHETVNGDNYCADCLESLDYVQCEDCGAWVSGDDLVRVNPDTRRETFVCPDCADRNYIRCDDCGDYFENFYISIDAPNITLCDHCADDYRVCNQCGNAYYEDDMYFDDDDDEWYCEDCQHDRESRHHINGYGYKPIPRFFTRQGELDHAPSELTFGVELEIDEGDDPQACAGELMAAADEIYCKHDGSLSDGVEIVTHPCTLDYHLYQLRWKQLCSIATGRGFKSHDTSTCGLHVHVGRAQLGSTRSDRDNTIGKVILLVDRLWAAIVPFTRRNEAKLDQWAARNRIPSTVENGDEAIRAALNSTHGRYYAVNLENSNTIEFRIFRGTLKRDTIAATLQLVSNLCGYAMAHDVETVLRTGWLDVVNFVHYDELSDYCKAMHLDHEPEGLKTLHLRCNDPAVASADPNQKIRVGDKVVVDNVHDPINGDWPDVFVGHIGTVVRISDSNPPIAIDFGEEIPPYSHSCTGRLASRTGFFLNAENLRLAAVPVTQYDALPDGTRVRLGQDYGNSYHTAGLWGTYHICPRGGSYVEFDDEMGGHTCDGNTENGHGLWVDLYDLCALHSTYIPA